MAAGQTGWMARAVATLCMLALVVGAALPTPHVPRVMQVLAEHADMVAEHGHSHGLEEDIAWAMHGHSHEKMDHDHSVAVLLEQYFDVSPVEIAAL